MVDLAWRYSCIAEIIWVTIRGVKAAAGRDTVGGVKHAAKPVGVVINSTATQLQTQKQTKKSTYSSELYRQIFYNKNNTTTDNL